MWKRTCKKNLSHKLEVRRDVNYMGISSTTKSPVNIPSGQAGWRCLQSPDSFVEEKQASNFSGILKPIWLERNNAFFAKCFSGVQLGHVQLLNFKGFYGNYSNLD